MECHRVGLLAYALTQVTLLFWWAAFNPGLFSIDSLDYGWQVTTGHWDSHHSVAYNALLWLSLQLTGGVGALTLAQTVGVAAGLAYLITGVRMLGGSWRWALGAAVLATALPSVGTMVIFVWKDIAFVIAQLFVTGTVIRIVACRRAGPSRVDPGLLWCLIGELTILALFRQNGFEVALATVAIAALFLPGLRLRLLAVGAFAAVAGLVANLVIYPAMGVRKEFGNVAVETTYSDIAVTYARAPGAFTAADLALIGQVANLDRWRTASDCYATADTMFSGGFAVSRAKALRPQLTALWIRLVKRAPATIIEARVCRGSLAWRPFVSGAAGHALRGYPTASLEALVAHRNSGPRAIAGTAYAAAVRSAPLSRPAHEGAAWLARLSQANTFEALLWRGVTWAYLAYAALILLVRRWRDRRVLALAAPILATQLSVLLLTPSQSPRYMLGPLIIGMVLTTLAVRRHAADDPQETM
jgi:hypothetical protein